LALKPELGFMGPVAGILRFVGLLNAAVWLGSMIFFTVVVGPAFFSQTMIEILTKPYAGRAAQVLIERYFILQNWCAGIAIAHLIADWLYTGRPFQKWLVLLLMTLFTIGLLGGYVLEPKMKELHLKMYAVQSPPQVRQSATRSFGILHGVSSCANLLVIGGVLVYFWSVASSVSAARFSSLNRFKT
jgi:hypothetical protein